MHKYYGSLLADIGGLVIFFPGLFFVIIRTGMTTAGPPTNLVYGTKYMPLYRAPLPLLLLEDLSNFFCRGIANVYPGEFDGAIDCTGLLYENLLEQRQYRKFVTYAMFKVPIDFLLAFFSAWLERIVA